MAQSLARSSSVVISEIQGSGVDIADLKKALAEVDLAKLESLRPGTGAR